MAGESRFPLKMADGIQIRTIAELKEHVGLADSDRVAFTQDELIGLLDMNVDVIYLCGERFTIPGSISGITYIGINNPMVEFDGEAVEPGIDLQGLECNIDDYIDDGNNPYGVDKFYIFFDNNPILGVKLLRAAAEKGSMKAQTVLGSCCMNGYGVEENRKEAVKWYQIAAGQGYAAAQYMLGNCYKYGDGVERNKKQAVKWFQKAARQGNSDAKYELRNISIILQEEKMKQIKLKKKPCQKCPYKLGIVKTLVNPCPQCRLNGYQTFEQFQKHNISHGQV